MQHSCIPLLSCWHNYLARRLHGMRQSLHIEDTCWIASLTTHYLRGKKFPLREFWCQPLKQTIYVERLQDCILGTTASPLIL